MKIVQIKLSCEVQPVHPSANANGFTGHVFISGSVAGAAGVWVRVSCSHFFAKQGSRSSD